MVFLKQRFISESFFLALDLVGIFWFANHLFCRIKAIYTFSEKEADLWFDCRDWKKRECEYRNRNPLYEIPDIVQGTELHISSHDVYREYTWHNNSCKKNSKYNRTRNRYSKGCYRLINCCNKSRYISYKKEHKRPSSPEEMIIDKVGDFSNFFPAGDPIVCYKSRKHKLYICTSPRPTPELLVLRTDSSVYIFFIDEVHLTYCWRVDDSEFSIPTKITPPVLHTVFNNRSLAPIIRFVQTLEALSVYREVTIKFWILTLKKLPKRCTHSDDTSKKMSIFPIVRVHWSILIDCMIAVVSTEEGRCHNRKKVFFYLGICIDSWDKCMSWIEGNCLLIFFYGICDIWSLYFSLVLESVWVYYINYIDSLIAILGY